MTKGITVDSKEIKFMLDEVCFTCIDAIKAQLKRLGWFEQYDEQELERIDVGKVGDVTVVDVYLDKEEVMIICYRHHHRGKEDLSFMVMEDHIAGDHLNAILKGLENINAVDAAPTETLQVV